MIILERLKNALAKANDLTDERKIEMIREEIRMELTDAADEIAILRKQLAEIVEYLSNKYEDFIPNEEFTSYDKKIEDIKTSVKKELED